MVSPRAAPNLSEAEAHVHAIPNADFSMSIAVPPETAPELFVSMARGQEIAKAEASLLAYGRWFGDAIDESVQAHCS